MTGRAREPEAAEVADALAKFIAAIDELCSAVDDERPLSLSEKAELQFKLGQLKSDIKAAAKRGTVHEHSPRRPPTFCEYAFFQPAVQKAAANFSLRINTPPGKTWISGLYVVRSNLSYCLFQLKDR